MCKLPPLEKYMEMNEEKTREVNYSFMADVKSTLRWHWLTILLIFAIITTAGGTGLKVMLDVGKQRDKKIADVQALVSEVAKAQVHADRRAATDSTGITSVLSRLDDLHQQSEHLNKRMDSFSVGQMSMNQRLSTLEGQVRTVHP